MNIKNLLLNSLTVLTLTLTLAACGGDDDDPFAPVNPVNPGGTQPSDGSNNTNRNSTTTTSEAWRLEFPKLKGGNNLVIVHTAPMPTKADVNYSVEWDISKKSQRWSCYQMHASNSVSNTKRYSSTDNQYPQDPDLPTQYRLSSDPFWGTGYDHGHICPSADRLCSSEANYQTFFLTNMQPQVNSFNAGIWEKMERQVRTWNRGDFRDTLYVCKGGTIDSEENIIRYLGSGANKIPVPKYFFMAILCKNSEGYKALGFWVEHDGGISSTTPLGDYVVNIRELEEKTGIDFFCNLPDNVEKQVETLPVDNVKRAWGLN